MRKRLYIPNYKAEKPFNKRPWIKFVLGILLVIALFIGSFLIAYNLRTYTAGKNDVYSMSKDELIQQVLDLKNQIAQDEQKNEELTSQMQRYKNVVDSLNISKIGGSVRVESTTAPQNIIKPALLPTLKPEQKYSPTTPPDVTQRPANTVFPNSTGTTTQKSVYGEQ